MKVLVVSAVLALASMVPSDAAAVEDNHDRLFYFGLSEQSPMRYHLYFTSDESFV